MYINGDYVQNKRDSSKVHWPSRQTMLLAPGAWVVDVGPKCFTRATSLRRRGGVNTRTMVVRNRLTPADRSLNLTPSLISRLVPQRVKSVVTKVFSTIITHVHHPLG